MAGDSGFGPISAISAKRPFTSWTNWCKIINLWPRKSITGKMILGRINTRWKTYHGPNGNFHGQYEYATNKELFLAKLKGEI